MTAVAERPAAVLAGVERLIRQVCAERRGRLEVDLSTWAAVMRGELPPLEQLMERGRRIRALRGGEAGGGYEVERVAYLLDAWAPRLKRGGATGLAAEVESFAWELHNRARLNEMDGWPFGVLDVA